MTLRNITDENPLAVFFLFQARLDARRSYSHGLGTCMLHEVSQIGFWSRNMDLMTLTGGRQVSILAD
jgi:hypothetical protein